MQGYYNGCLLQVAVQNRGARAAGCSGSQHGSGGRELREDPAEVQGAAEERGEHGGQRHGGDEEPGEAGHQQLSLHPG